MFQPFKPYEGISMVKWQIRNFNSDGILKFTLCFWGACSPVKYVIGELGPQPIQRLIELQCSGPKLCKAQQFDPEVPIFVVPVMFSTLSGLGM